MSVKILTKKVDLYNNSRNESQKLGCEKCVQVVNLGPEKRVYNKIFLIVSYNYKNYGFLSLQEIISKVYVSIGIWSLCFEDMKYKIDKILYDLT